MFELCDLGRHDPSGRVLRARLKGTSAGFDFGEAEKARGPGQSVGGFRHSAPVAAMGMDSREAAGPVQG